MGQLGILTPPLGEAGPPRSQARCLPRAGSPPTPVPPGCGHGAWLGGPWRPVEEAASWPQALPGSAGRCPSVGEVCHPVQGLGPGSGGQRADSLPNSATPLPVPQGPHLLHGRVSWSVRLSLWTHPVGLIKWTWTSPAGSEAAEPGLHTCTRKHTRTHPGPPLGDVVFTCHPSCSHGGGEGTPSDSPRLRWVNGPRG